VALALVPRSRRALKKPIHLCFSHDEEVSCIGIPSLIKQLGRDLRSPQSRSSASRPDACRPAHKKTSRR
jgi:hypothetical protein